ncbi:MAG: hypothetical protein Q7S23_02075 [bacterium]|nr:hypothetical protein [bacterium]
MRLRRLTTLWTATSRRWWPALFVFALLFAHPASAQGFVRNLSGYVYLILSYVLQAVAALVGQLTVMITGLLTSVIVYNDFINFEAVNLGWVLVRDISNMFFVVVLLLIAVATILRLESYNLKRLLPKLLLMAIFVNFSKVISGLLIDAAQVVTLTFANAIVQVTAGNIYAKFGLAELFAVSQDAFLPGSGEENIALFYLFLSLLLATVMLIIAFSVILAYLVVFALRIVALWILIILSPLAYVLSAFPQGERYSREWWQTFSKYVTVGPILMFFFWLAIATSEQAFTTTLDTTRAPTTALSEGGVAQLEPSLRVGIGKAGEKENVLKFLVMTCLMLGGLVAAQKAGVAGSQFAGSVMGSLRSYGQRMARAGIRAGTSPLRGAGWLAREGTYGAGRLTDRWLGRRVQDKRWYSTIAGLLSPTVRRQGTARSRQMAEQQSFGKSVGDMADFLNSVTKPRLRWQRVKIAGVTVGAIPRLEGEKTKEGDKAFRSLVSKEMSELNNLTETEKASEFDLAIKNKNQVRSFAAALALNKGNHTDDYMGYMAQRYPDEYGDQEHSQTSFREHLMKRIGGTFGKRSAGDLGVLLKDQSEESALLRGFGYGFTRPVLDSKGRPTGDVENVLVSEDSAREELEVEYKKHPTIDNNPRIQANVLRKLEEKFGEEFGTIIGRGKMENFVAKTEGKAFFKFHPTAQPFEDVLSGGKVVHSRMGRMDRLGKIASAKFDTVFFGRVVAQRGHGLQPRAAEFAGFRFDQKTGSMALDIRSVYDQFKAKGHHGVANLFGQKNISPEQAVAVERIMNKAGVRNYDGTPGIELDKYAEEAFTKSGKTYEPTSYAAARAGPLSPELETYVNSRTGPEWETYLQHGTPGALDINGRPAASQHEEIPEEWRLHGGYAPKGGRPLMETYSPEVQAASQEAYQQLLAAGMSESEANEAYGRLHQEEIRAGTLYATSAIIRHEQVEEKRSESLDAMRGVASIERRPAEGYAEGPLAEYGRKAVAGIGVNFESAEAGQRYGVVPGMTAVNYDESTAERKANKDIVAKNLAEDYGKELVGKGAAFRQEVAQGLGKQPDAVTDEELRDGYAAKYQTLKPADADKQYADRVVGQWAAAEFKEGNAAGRVEEVRDASGAVAGYHYRDAAVLGAQQGEALRQMSQDKDVSSLAAGEVSAQQRQAEFKKRLDSASTLSLHNNAAFGSRFTARRHEYGHTLANQLNDEQRQTFRGTLSEEQQQLFDQETPEEYLAHALGVNDNAHTLSEQTRNFLDELEVTDKTGKVAKGARYRGRKLKPDEPLAPQEKAERAITNEEIEEIHRQRQQKPDVQIGKILTDAAGQQGSRAQEVTRAEAQVQQANASLTAEQQKLTQLEGQRGELLRETDAHIAKGQAARQRAEQAKARGDKLGFAANDREAMTERDLARDSQAKVQPQLNVLNTQVATQRGVVDQRQQALTQAEALRQQAAASAGPSSQAFAATLQRSLDQLSDAELDGIAEKVLAEVSPQWGAATEESRSALEGERGELAALEGDRSKLKSLTLVRQQAARYAEARDVSAAQEAYNRSAGQLGAADQRVNEQEQVVQTQEENVEHARIELQNAKVELPEAAAAAGQERSALQAIQTQLTALMGNRDVLTRERDQHLTNQNAASQRLNAARASGNALAEQQALEEATREQALAAAAEGKIAAPLAQLNQQIETQSSAKAAQETRVAAAVQRDETARQDVGVKRQAYDAEYLRLQESKRTLMQHRSDQQALGEAVQINQAAVRQAGVGLTPQEIAAARQQADQSAQQLAQLDQTIGAKRRDVAGKEAALDNARQADQSFPELMTTLQERVSQTQQRREAAKPENVAARAQQELSESRGKLTELEQNRDELARRAQVHNRLRKRAADQGSQEEAGRQERLAQAAERDLRTAQQRIAKQQQEVQAKERAVQALQPKPVPVSKGQQSLTAVEEKFLTARQGNREEVAGAKQEIGAKEQIVRASQQELGNRVKVRDQRQLELAELNAQARRAVEEGNYQAQEEAQTLARAKQQEVTAATDAVTEQQDVVARDSQALEGAQADYRRRVEESVQSLETFAAAVRDAAGTLSKDELAQQLSHAQSELEANNKEAEEKATQGDAAGARAAHDRAQRAQIIRDQLDYTVKRRRLGLAPKVKGSGLKDADQELNVAKVKRDFNYAELAEKRTGLVKQHQAAEKDLRKQQERQAQAAPGTERKRADDAVKAAQDRFNTVGGQIKGVDKEIGEWDDLVLKNAADVSDLVLAQEELVIAQRRLQEAKTIGEQEIPAMSKEYEKLDKRRIAAGAALQQQGAAAQKARSTGNVAALRKAQQAIAQRTEEMGQIEQRMGEIQDFSAGLVGLVEQVEATATAAEENVGRAAEAAAEGIEPPSVRAVPPPKISAKTAAGPAQPPTGTAGLGSAPSALHSPSQHEIAAMSQDEFAEYLTQNRLEVTGADVYNLLTRKAELRHLQESDIAKEMASTPGLLESLKEFGKKQTNNWNEVGSGKTQVENVRAIGAESDWLNYQVGKGKESTGETHKGYLTFKDTLRDLTPERLNQFMAALAKAGYNGQVKVAPTGQRAKYRFDNVVMHGATPEDVQKAAAVARNLFGNQLSAVGRGIDRGGTSHTDNLAKEVEARRAARKSTSPRASQPVQEPSPVAAHPSSPAPVQPADSPTPPAATVTSQKIAAHAAEQVERQAEVVKAFPTADLATLNKMLKTMSEALAQVSGSVQSLATTLSEQEEKAGMTDKDASKKFDVLGKNLRDGVARIGEAQVSAEAGAGVTREQADELADLLFQINKSLQEMAQSKEGSTGVPEIPAISPESLSGEPPKGRPTI